MDSRCIIMNYTVPPSLEDIQSLSEMIFEGLPEEILRHCEDVVLIVEDFVDDMTMQDLEVEDPFELLALFKNGKEIAPGIQKKVANEEDSLIVFRRSVLDMWCESEDNLETVLRNVLIEELGRAFDLSDDDIHDLTERHYA